MNSLSSQLESSKNSCEKIEQLEGSVTTIQQKFEKCEKELESCNEELVKLKAEKKMLLKHDQVTSLNAHSTSGSLSTDQSALLFSVRFVRG